MTFKPTLAAAIETEEDYAKLVYPLLGSPKLDGIRVCCHPELGPVSRSLKPIPNKFIRQYLSHPTLRGLDGEVIVGDPTSDGVFNRTQSAVMSQDGNPDFTYYVFDHFSSYQLRCPFALRLNDVKNQVARYAEIVEGPIRVVYLEHHQVDNRDDLDFLETDVVNGGYEGLMLRKPTGHYKCNRSTLKEQILLKLKRFTTDTAVIIGYEPLYRNANEATIDARGFTKRSSHQAGMVEDDSRIGKFKARGIEGRWKGVDFDCGSGLTDDQRLEYRSKIDSLIGKHFDYKYQMHGSKDKPRIPIFKGLRPELD